MLQSWHVLLCSRPARAKTLGPVAPGPGLRNLMAVAMHVSTFSPTKCLLQVRVMPRCWYVLLRFWLRVDNVLVRMRDTRMMCTFGSRQPQVHRELKWSEGTFAELRRESAPANQASRTGKTINTTASLAHLLRSKCCGCHFAAVQCRFGFIHQLSPLPMRLQLATM